MPDENLDAVNAVFESHARGEVDLLAPLILPFEIINGIRYAVSSKKLTKRIARNLIDDFLDIEIGLSEVDFKEAFAISLRKNYSIYDASYIYLAKKHKVKLLTLDKKLKV